MLSLNVLLPALCVQVGPVSWGVPLALADPALPGRTGRKNRPETEYSIFEERRENFAAISTTLQTTIHSLSATLWPRSRRCARLFVCSCAHSFRKRGATAGAWNFGLCATRSREPRQARKGATVPGTPRVPQITRGSSHRRKSYKLSAMSRCMGSGGNGRRNESNEIRPLV